MSILSVAIMWISCYIRKRRMGNGYAVKSSFQPHDPAWWFGDHVSREGVSCSSISGALQIQLCWPKLDACLRGSTMHTVTTLNYDKSSPIFDLSSHRQMHIFPFCFCLWLFRICWVRGSAYDDPSRSEMPRFMSMSLLAHLFKTGMPRSIRTVPS